MCVNSNKRPHCISTTVSPCIGICTHILYIPVMCCKSPHLRCAINLDGGEYMESATFKAGHVNPPFRPILIVTF